MSNVSVSRLRLLSIIAVFSALQAAVHLSMGPWLIIPGIPASTLPFLAFPCSFLAAATYIFSNYKQGAVGLTMLIGGIIAFLFVGFLPVLFQFIFSAGLSEAFIAVAGRFKKGKGFFFALGAVVMLARALGFMTGFTIFMPIAAMKHLYTLLGLVLFFGFSAALSMVIGGFGSVSSYEAFRRFRRVEQVS